MTSASRITLVVLAAGLGSRYGGLKQLDGVGPAGETLMDYAVFDAARAGVTKVVFVVRQDMVDTFVPRALDRYHARLDVAATVQALDDVPAGASVPEGRTKPWGTAHAILAAEPEVETPFIVVNADDFYGAESYAAAVRALRASSTWAVLGYRLGDTLSGEGGVNRALLRTDGERLTDIEEIRDIVQLPDGRLVGKSARVRALKLSPDDLVSMNMWALTPEVFPILRARFKAFLETADTTAELLLPDIVGKLVRGGAVSVRVIPSPSRWFGMTHAADRPRVAAELAALAAAHAYPARLW